MVVSKRNVCIALLVVCAVLAQVGCGSKSGKRQRVSRIADRDGKPLTAPDAGGSSQDNVGDLGTGAGAGTAEKIRAILDQQKTLTEAVGVSETDISTLLGDGSYTLTSVFTTYRYLKAPADFASVFRSKVNIENELPSMATPATEKEGSIAPETGLSTELEIPTQFKLKAQVISKEDSRSRALVSTISDESVSATFSEVSPTIKNSLTNILFKVNEAPMGTLVRFLKADGGSTLRITIELQEEADEASKVSMIILDYSFAADSAPIDPILSNTNAQ